MSALQLICSIRPLLRGRHSFLAVVLGALLLPLSISAQVSFTGTAATENFGQQAILSASAPKSFSFTVAAGTKVGSIAVLTTGVANLDFANTTGTTCAAVTYASTTSCSVSVTFTPQAAGPRLGAVAFFSKGGNTGLLLGSVPIYGMGIGAQIAYGPGVVTAVDRTMHGLVGLGNPGAMTADAAGNLFVLDSAGSRPGYSLVKITASGATTTLQPVVNGLGLYLPSSVAVDGAGNLYIGDLGRRVIVVPAGSGPATEITPLANGIPLNYPSGLAVDGAGDLFIADFINNRVLEVPAGGGATVAISPVANGIALNDPHGLSLDGAGNLFIADLGNNRVVKVPLGGGSATAIEATADGESLRNPVGVALDGAGDLFIADNVNHRVVEVPSSGAPTAIDPDLYFSGQGEVYSVAVDGAGDLFFAQGGLAGGANIVEEKKYGQSTALSFPTLTQAGSIDTVDGVQTFQLVNIGNQPLVLTALSFPADFAEMAESSNDCNSSTMLGPGQKCDITVEFAPQNGGALNEAITLTDNAIGSSNGHQSIALSGTAWQDAVLTSPSPGATLASSGIKFTWTTGVGVRQYNLWLGTRGPGSSSLFSSGNTTATSVTVPSLPAKGAKVYARLYSLVGKVWLYQDFTYFESSTPAALTSPAPGSVLPGPTATFKWSTASGATAYGLLLGSKGPGSSDLFTSGQTLSTSATAANLPTTGATIYARLVTVVNGAQLAMDYTYRSAASATLTSPVAASLLAGPKVYFTWTAGSAATGYALTLGSTGAGSSDIYNSGKILATSSTANRLPTNGGTIYARLTTYFNTVAVYVDSIYTAPTRAALLTPVSGAVLAGSTVTFSWTAGAGATSYALWLGASGPGSSSLFASAPSTATSVTATKLPVNGQKIYARLFTNFSGGQSYADYTFTAK